MMEVVQKRVANRMLRRLPKSAFDRLAPHLEAIDLPLNYPLVRPHEPIEDVCFIESGSASIVAEGADGTHLEVGHVGFEGITGHPVILGVDRTASHTSVQFAGEGLRVATRLFRRVLDDSETRALLLRYVYTCELQLTSSALAAAKYSLQQRLARWLLMCQDRLQCEELPITHESLSMMLGVRRAGVTDQLHVLEGQHAIKSTRGLVRILDRQMLIDIAAGCYGLPEQEYEELIGRSHAPMRNTANGKVHWVNLTGMA